MKKTNISNNMHAGGGSACVMRNTLIQHFRRRRWQSYSGDKNIEKRVDSVLKLMTLEEKIGQMTQFLC